MFRVDYHQWSLAAAYILILAVFLYGMLQPRRKAEWRSAGVAQAFRELAHSARTANVASAVTGLLSARPNRGS
jgi:hypothetical protein